MAIADKLTKLSTDITNAYTAIDNKGGTIPANKNTDNLASAIGSISTGTTPTGTKQVSITQNGTTTEDVTNYASAEISVNVPQPSGTKQISITENGTITEDVTNYSSAEIMTNVPMSAPKVEGTFTLASAGQTPIIEHNLGTTKICAIIYPGGRITSSGGYQFFFDCFVNVNDLIDDTTWELDFTSYNTKFSDVTYVDESERNTKLRTSFTHQSPWTTQNTWNIASNNSAPVSSSYTITENTFKTKLNYNFAPGTYKYIIFALN